MQIIEILFRLLVYPGLIFAFLIGSMLYWLYRKVRARFQARRGPPWYQVFADIIKLLSKETIIPNEGKFFFLLAPVLAIIGCLAPIILLPIGSPYATVSFTGDLIVILIFLILSNLALIIAGINSRSPYKTIGAFGEASLMIAYELPLVLSALTAGIYAGNLSAANIVQTQLSKRAFVLHYPLATIAFTLCMLPKMGKRPFDIPEAEHEVITGPLAGYSGALLALFEITSAIKWFVIPGLAVILFFGGSTNIIEFLGKCIGITLILTLIDIHYPRFRIDQSFKFFVKIALPIAIVDFVRVLLGW
ncbi:NADH-quinone oxidoreductase subunit H [Candidatus Bathyarchaeota archaeon]|nr:NADH-quinone oxidoreductase subunit H [Candidatus Bathyarchaeota archaeon]